MKPTLTDREVAQFRNIQRAAVSGTLCVIPAVDMRTGEAVPVLGELQSADWVEPLATILPAGAADFILNRSEVGHVPDPPPRDQPLLLRLAQVVGENYDTVTALKAAILREMQIAEDEASEAEYNTRLQEAINGAHRQRVHAHGEDRPARRSA